MSDRQFSPTPTKAGIVGDIGRFVLTALVLLLITVLIIATWANWRRDQRVTFRVFDPVWWGVGRRQAEPIVEGARTAAHQVYDSVWGAGGLIDQAEVWIKERKAAPPPPANQPANVSTADHERAFAEAENRFEDGVVAYKQAKSVPGKPLNRGAIQEAITSFTVCRDLLNQHLPEYAKLPDRQLSEQTKAEDLQRLDLRFLEQAKKLSEIR